MNWRLVFADRARRDLRRLDRSVAARILVALERLAAEGSGDVMHLTESPDLRLRVGDWRVRFQFDYVEQQVLVLRILPRGRAYRE